MIIRLTQNAIIVKITHTIVILVMIDLLVYLANQQEIGT